jgi:hypothetical protein
MHPVLIVAVTLYIIFLLFYVLHGIFLAYHLLRFSVRHDTARTFTGVFAIMSLAVLVIGITMLLRIRWDAPLFPPAGSSPFSRVL